MSRDFAKIAARDRVRRYGAESVTRSSSPPIGTPSVQPYRKTDRASPVRPSKLPEPVIVAEFWANRRGESIRIQLREYEGSVLLDVRKHYTDSAGKLAPTKKGISIVVHRLPDLAAGIIKAERLARELGLLDGGAP